MDLKGEIVVFFWFEVCIVDWGKILVLEKRKKIFELGYEIIGNLIFFEDDEEMRILEVLFLVMEVVREVIVIVVVVVGF